MQNPVQKQNQKEFNLFSWVHRELTLTHLESNGAKDFTIPNGKGHYLNTWYGILRYLKKQGLFQTFNIGLDEKDELVLTIKGFNFDCQYLDFMRKRIKARYIKNQLNVTAQEVAQANIEAKTSQDGVYEEHIKEETKAKNIEKVSRKDSSTSELNREVMKELVAQ